MKFALFLFFLFFTQICPNCFETRWQTRTAAVSCMSAPAVIAEFQKLGFTVNVKVWELKDGEKICDILGIK